MAKVHERFPFELVITVGDNLYGSQRPKDFQTKFELPYKVLLDAGVKFYASLGNHDERERQRYYKLFNMDGKLYYTFKAPKQSVRFFALDSTYPIRSRARGWRRSCRASGRGLEDPLLPSPAVFVRRAARLDADRCATVLEPLFVKYGVSVVFAGHDHFYERTKPQKGIVHFVTGSGGQLRQGNIDRRDRPDRPAASTPTAPSWWPRSIGDELYFNVISRTGTVVDSGVIQRRKQA